VATLAAGAVGSEVSLCLDFFPNPNHAPLYVAAKQGWFDEAGLTVDLVVPANVSDPLKLAAAGRFDVALTPQINYLIARSQGLPLIAIGALIDRNLGGLLARTSEGIVDLADLRGKRIGYSLAPLEPILWETMLSCAGVDIHEVELVNVGYNTVPSLLSGGVDAIGAFRNYEAIQLELLGEQATFFPQEVYCIPDTYDILLVCRASLVEERPDALRGLLAAVARGVGMTRSSPNDALALFLQANPDLDDELNRRSFAATVPLFATGLQLDDPEQWAAMQTYLFEHGLIDHVFDLDVLYTAELLPPETP
jgi:putative hydroxymethylpyrimidine transport system substrate-binding protein